MSLVGIACPCVTAALGGWTELADLGIGRLPFLRFGLLAVRMITAHRVRIQKGAACFQRFQNTYT